MHSTKMENSNYPNDNGRQVVSSNASLVTSSNVASSNVSSSNVSSSNVAQPQVQMTQPSSSNVSSSNVSSSNVAQPPVQVTQSSQMQVMQPQQDTSGGGATQGAILNGFNAQNVNQFQLPFNLGDPQANLLFQQLSMAARQPMPTQQFQFNALYHPQNAMLLQSLLLGQNGITQAAVATPGIAALNPQFNANIQALAAANLPALTAMQQAPLLNPGNANSIPTATRHAPEPKPLTHRPAVGLYLDYDEQTLTGYQCLLRQQLELFEARPDEVRGSAQGRNTPISLGQVGIRCRHCAAIPKAARNRGAVYYSKTIDGLYQVAQNMSKLHLCKTCHKIPEETQKKLIKLQKVNNRASGGKEYWAEGLRVLGIYEDGSVLRFKPKNR